MFVEVEMERTVLVHPENMKSNEHVLRALLKKLMKDFQSINCTEEHGYYVTLTTLESIGEGNIWERRGHAAYPVRYRCIVFKPLRGEVLPAVVDQVLNKGLVCNCGPLEQVYVGHDPSEKKDAELEKGTTENTVEPNVVEGYTFHDGTKDDGPYWFNVLNQSKIQKGDVVLLKIRGLQWNRLARNFTAVGVLRGQNVDLKQRWPEISKTANATQGSEMEDAGGWETNEGAGGWTQDKSDGDALGWE